MRFIEEHNEVVPNLASKVQKIWDDCGTYVTSLEPAAAAKDIEYFVQHLIEGITDDLHEYTSGLDTEKILTKLGYIK